MHGLSRILACGLLAVYAAAAVPPCGGGPERTRAETGASHGHAAHAGDASGHGDHAGHGDRAAAPPVAEWTAPCPCGCGDAAPGTADTSPRVGWALAQLRPGLVAPVLSTGVATPEARRPADPLLLREPVPI